MSSITRRIHTFFKHRLLRQVILLVLVLWAWVVLVMVLVINAYGKVDHAQPADVIIVLGAGLQADNTPGPALIRRAGHAADLWKAGYAPTIICSGGNPGHNKRTEADACAEVLRGHGIPSEAIVLEDQSRSTEENAFDSKVIMDTHGWQTAIIVSDQFHLFRANRLFRNAGIPAVTSPAAPDPSPLEYWVYVAREVVALHWQLLKEALNLPITYVQSI